MANTFNTKTVLMIAALGFVAEEPEDYLDIALVYAIIGFISTVAVLRCCNKQPETLKGDTE